MRGLDASFVEWGNWETSKSDFDQTGQPAQPADEPGPGSILNSARFHHKFRLRRDGTTSFSQFISGREINAASAFKFYLNVVLIQMGLQIPTVPGARRVVLPSQPTP